MYDDNDRLRAGTLPTDPFSDCQEWTPPPVSSNGDPKPEEPGDWRTVARCMADVDERRTEWLWQDRFPLSMVSILYGAKGVGKGTIAADLITAVTTGGRLPTGHELHGELEYADVTPGAVVYLNAEDALQETIRPRLKHADRSKVVHMAHAERTAADRTERRILTLAGPGKGTSYWWDEHILPTLEEVRPVLFLIDTLFSHAGADVNSNEEMGPIMARLALVSEQLRMATVVVHHAVKIPHARAASDVSGATCIGTTARSLLLAGTDEGKQRRALFHLDSNVGFEAPPVGYVAYPFRWTTTDLKVDEVRRHGGRKGEETRAAVADYLERATAHGPRTVAVLTDGAIKARLSVSIMGKLRGSLGYGSHQIGREHYVCKPEQNTPEDWARFRESLKHATAQDTKNAKE